MISSCKVQIHCSEQLEFVLPFIELTILIYNLYTNCNISIHRNEDNW